MRFSRFTMKFYNTVFSIMLFQLESKQRNMADLERRLMETELRLEKERQQWLMERSSKSPSQHNIEVSTRGRR